MRTQPSAKDTFIVLDSEPQILVRLRASTVKDLFHQALEGMASVLYSPYRALSSQLTVPIRVSSIDVNALVVDFLSEALWQGEVYKAVFPEMRVKRFTNSEIEADLLGIPVSRLDRPVQSVSYTGLRVARHTDGLWQAEVTLEI